MTQSSAWIVDSPVTKDDLRAWAQLMALNDDR